VGSAPGKGVLNIVKTLTKGSFYPPFSCIFNCELFFNSLKIKRFSLKIKLLSNFGLDAELLTY